MIELIPTIGGTVWIKVRLGTHGLLAHAFYISQKEQQKIQQQIKRGEI